MGGKTSGSTSKRRKPRYGSSNEYTPNQSGTRDYGVGGGWLMVHSFSGP